MRCASSCAVFVALVTAQVAIAPPLIPDSPLGWCSKILCVLTDGPEGTLNRLDRGTETDDSEKTRL